MSYLSDTRSQPRRTRGCVILHFAVIVLLLGLTTPEAQGDDTAAAKKAANVAAKLKYMPAVDLLPKSTAGYMRIPNAPDFCEAYKKIHLSELFNDPAMKPFIDAQRARAENYLESLNSKVGIRPKDLYEIASGEVAVAWLPFKDKRRPYSLCVVGDIRGFRAKADKVMEQIDKDLKAGGAERKDVKYRDQEIRVYSTKPKPGQLKVDEIAISVSDARIIASDRGKVVQELLDAIAGEPQGQPLSRLQEFKTVMGKSEVAIKAAKDNATKCMEWFAEPFQMGRILRQVFEIERGNQTDVLKLLESQGFTAVKAAGGIGMLAGQRYDVLHRGFVLAPGPFEKAAKMLGFFNRAREEIPVWIHDKTATFTRVNWRMSDAFWASEGLINEALGDEIFRPIIKDIRDDEEGPQIDIENEFLPSLDDQLILVTDNTVPIDIDSERMLVAIRLRDGDKVRKVIKKAMEVEPDASRLDVLPGVEIWRVQRGEGKDDFEAELAELGFEDDGEGEDQKPLLDHWAVAVVDASPTSPHAYLMFSSHPDFLVSSAKRIKDGVKADALSDLDSVKMVEKALRDLGAKSIAVDRVTRLKAAIQVKYQLLRAGNLKDSDSILSVIFRRLTEGEDGGQPDPLNAAKLPPINKIEKHLPDGGAFIEAVDEGWLMTGFFLR